jgi:uncharacterized membrane protein YGL010W
MNTALQAELTEFRRYHRNPYNVWFHILCGCIYMAALLNLGGAYRYVLTAAYGILIAATMGDVRTAILSTGAIIVVMQSLPHLTPAALAGLAFVAYMAPEVSHYATGEPAVLTLDSITPFTAFVNVVYLLPFSMKSLT